MKIYTLHTKQKLPITVQEAWNFFSDPHNLKMITPEEMGFTILSGADKEMYGGQLIKYTVSPIANIKVKWVTKIIHVEPLKYFVDEQLYGPYALWHHKHFIHPIPGGVLMEDIIDYKVPFGILGQLVHPLLVKPKLDDIFDYRKKALIDLFGVFSPPVQNIKDKEAVDKYEILN
ncbi:SRPBCC family protein [Aquimarina sp. ERC-38]|uniref:SRPBCC family protein n=1 Tax=Aquimarina sp. ERC-38 TaxID=2949996 RepID=UPI0022464D67|nr:SRPBCC family protein [Aquimarina sp. ERC-38]UZO80173.1 SRPBCC family protein [Aquimarina sp. ERC-38]